MTGRGLATGRGGAPPPHALRNQSEFPRSQRHERYVRRFYAARPELTPFDLQTVIPYHLVHGGDRGHMRVWVFAVPPVVRRQGYKGEAFLRMMSFYTRRHPSGLPDSAFLRTPRPGA
jgi:hypothetical protein